MESKKLEKPCENATFQALQGVMKPDEETGGVFQTLLTWNLNLYLNLFLGKLLKFRSTGAQRKAKVIMIMQR